MKKQVQIENNKAVLEIVGKYLVRDKWGHNHSIPVSYVYCTKRLRNCSATVLYTDDGYYLQSYSTIIAFIPAGQNVCYDFLRYVYDYTATSAQHIAKFARDYGNGDILRYKEV